MWVCVTISGCEFLCEHDVSLGIECSFMVFMVKKTFGLYSSQETYL